MNLTKQSIGERENSYLETEAVHKLLLKFSVPCVLSMLVSALYNIVDQVFIGQSIGYLGNAATNVVYPFTVVALALSLLIGDGSAALLSLSLGRGDNETSHRCIGNGIIITGIVSVLLMVVGICFSDEILNIFGVTEASYEYAKDYFNIIMLGIPFYIITSSLNGSIRADGSPGYSMFATVLGAIINLILDPVAIFILGMGVKGAAIATIIGQIASFIVSILYFRKTKLFKLKKESFRLDLGILTKVCQLGISSFITQIAIVVIISIANNLIGIYGPQSEYGADIPLSAIGIVMKVFAIVIAFSVGIAVGGQPIVGYNYGAKNYKRVFEVYKLVIIANIVIGVTVTLIFELCPQLLVDLFGSGSELYNQYACLCFRIYLGSILLCCIQKASSIFLQSIGRPVKATLLSLSRDVVFFVPGIIILASRFGVVGMLWSAVITDIISFVLTVFLILSEYRRTMNEDKIA